MKNPNDDFAEPRVMDERRERLGISQAYYICAVCNGRFRVTSSHSQVECLEKALLNDIPGQKVKEE